MFEPENDKVFISYSSEDIDLVRTIRAGFKNHANLDCFVAHDAIQPGTHPLDAITYALANSRACLFLVTPDALDSSWFAFETILTLERSQQRGLLNCVMLLHGVSEEQLPKFALFHVIDKYVLCLDESGMWQREQIDQVLKTIQDSKRIDNMLPVGNVAHAQAWSHYFGYHHVIHPYLAEKIRKCCWYKDSRMPIAVYEIVPKNCVIPSVIKGDKIRKVGALEPFEVKMAGNIRRKFELNVYCIEDNGEKYYCVVQYPNVLSAIQKMAASTSIDMDEAHKRLQVARLYYTLHAILQHSNVTGCRQQARLLWCDDSVEDATDVLLKAVKRDIEFSSFDTTADEMGKVLRSLEADNFQEKQYDASIVHDSGDTESNAIYLQIENYLESSDVHLYSNTAGAKELGAIDETLKMVRWLILIINQDRSSKSSPFKMQTLSILANCVNNRQVRIIPVIQNSAKNCNNVNDDDHGNSNSDDVTNDNGECSMISGSMHDDGIIPYLFKWVTYIETRTAGYEQRVYQALKGGDIPLTLEAGHIPAGNIGYGFAWGYVVNYLTTVLRLIGEPFQTFLRANNVSCPAKLYLLIPQTCDCPGKITNTHVSHVKSTEAKDDQCGGANIPKGLDMYCLADVADESKVHNFIGQYPAPLRTLHLMNECRIAGINPESMKREQQRFCDTLQDIMWSPVGEGLHTKCELVFYDDTDNGDLQRQLLPKIQSELRLENSYKKRPLGTAVQSDVTSVKQPRFQ